MDVRCSNQGLPELVDAGPGTLGVESPTAELLGPARGPDEVQLGEASLL